MIETDTQTETSPKFDSFQRRLAKAFQESGNGQSAVALARVLTYEYFQSSGKSGIISFDKPLTLEEKLPLENLPGNIEEELLGLASQGEPLSLESQEYLRANIAEGKAVVHCILGAYREASRPK